MPNMKDVRDLADELQNGIVEGLEEQLGFLPPEGEDHRIAEMTLESAKAVFDAARSGDLDTQTFPTHFARLYYLEQVRDGKQTLTSAQIEEKTAALAKNEKFLEVFADKHSPEDCMNALDSLFGGPRAEHLDSWVKECEQPVTRNYEQEFETLCGDTLQGSERERAKQHFVNMGILNEEVRMLEYSKALSPRQMYDKMTSKTLQDEKAASQGIYELVDSKEQQFKRVQKIKSTSPKAARMPAHLDRFARFFFNHSAGPEAREENQNLIDRLCSDKPEDRAFQKEFTVDCINKMLAVPDKALCPETTEEATTALDQYYFEMRALQDSTNILASLSSQDYHVPGYIREALMHKSNLYMQNVEKHITANKIDPAQYEELSLLKEFDSDAIAKISGNLFHKGKGPLGSSVLALTAVVHDLKQTDTTLPDAETYDKLFLREKDLFLMKEGAQATASDSFSLMPDNVKKPKELGAWEKFWHIFGFYNEEFETYQREKTTYDNWVKKQAQEKDESLGKGAARFGANGVNAEHMEKEFEKGLSLDELTKQASAEYKKTLDEAFGKVEEKTGNAINRLDYVMVGPRSLRAVLEEEYLNTHIACDELISSEGTELEEFYKQSLENGHAYDLLVYADLQHVSLQCAALNEKAEMSVKDGKIGITSLKRPEVMTKLSPLMRPQLEQQSVNVTKEAKLSLVGEQNATERMHLMDNSRAALHQLNFWQNVKEVCDRTAAALPDTKNVFSLNNAAIASFKEAYLLSRGETPEQIYNTTKQAKLRKVATESVQKQINDPACAKDLATIAVEGIQKIKGLVDEYTKGADLSKEICSPKMKTVCALASAASNLYKAISGNEALKTEACKVLVEQKGKDVTNAAEIAKAHQELAVFSNTLVGLNTALEHIRDGRETGCRYCMGAVEHAKEGAGKIFAGEMALKVISERMKSGTPLSESMAASESKHIASWSPLATDFPKNLDGGDGHAALYNLCKVNQATDGVKFASYALSGGLARDCQVEIAGNEFGAKFTYTPPASEMAQDSVVAELDLTQTEPKIEQNLMV